MVLPELSVVIRPIGDRVLIYPVSPTSTTVSGIILSSAGGEKPQEGIVMALGKGGVGSSNVNPQDHLKVGDRVLFAKYAGDDLSLKDIKGKDIDVKMLHVDAILGVAE